MGSWPQLFKLWITDARMTMELRSIRNDLPQASLVNVRRQIYYAAEAGEKELKISSYFTFPGSFIGF